MFLTLGSVYAQGLYIYDSDVAKCHIKIGSLTIFYDVANANDGKSFFFAIAQCEQTLSSATRLLNIVMLFVWNFSNHVQMWRTRSSMTVTIEC